MTTSVQKRSVGRSLAAWPLLFSSGGDARQLLSDLGETPTVNWPSYEDLLGGTGQPQKEVLSSIFSYVVLRGEEQPPLAYLAALRLCECQ